MTNLTFTVHIAPGNYQIEDKFEMAMADIINEFEHTHGILRFLPREWTGKILNSDRDTVGSWEIAEAKEGA